MQDPNENISQLILDIRDSSCIITGKMKTNQKGQDQYGSVVVKSVNEFVYRLATKIPTTLIIEEDTNVAHICNQLNDKPSYKFAQFLSNAKTDFISSKIGTKTLQKSKAELCGLVMLCIRQFTDQFFYPNVQLIQIIHPEDINEQTMTILKNVAAQTYNLEDHQITTVKPKTMLSLDLGTGYYLAMYHDIQGQYEIMRYGFRAKTDGSLYNTGQSPVKFPSDVFFNPTFNLRTVPKLIQQGKIVDIISNTSISVAKEDGWIQIQHYKKYLYKVEPYSKVTFDSKTLCSNIQLTVPLYNGQIDLMHVFLVIMVHIYNAYTSSKLQFDNVRISTPISAEKVHFDFMKTCAEYVFKNSQIDFTTEPEAAFSYLMTIVKEQNIDAFKHIILMDGGDGTFDYVYVKLHQQSKIWSKVHGKAFNCAGTNIYAEFRKKLVEVFTDQDFKTNALINEWYDMLKKKTAEKLIDQNFDISYNCIKMQPFFDHICEEADNQRVFRVLLKDKEVTKQDLYDELNRVGGQQKILQLLKLQMLPEVLMEICKPIDDFVRDFDIVFGEIEKEMQKQNEDDQPILLVFVGGLASNLTIMDRIRRKADEYELNFTSAEEPQVAIIKGIPVQRANISLRNFDSKSKYNLYLLDSKNIDVRVTNLYKMSYGNKSVEYGPQKPGHAVNNALSLLLKKDAPLAPGNNTKLIDRRLSLDKPIDIMFFRTNYENVPLFFNLNRSENRFVFNQKGTDILRESQLFHQVVTIQQSDLSQKVKDLLQVEQMIDRKIAVEVHLVMDHRRFHPNPVVHIYGKVPNTKKLVLLKEVEMWDWFEQTYAENPVEYQFLRE